MNDIAVRAEVHPSTVSLCLNDSPRVSTVTKERVWKVARELDYRPHPLLRTLMQHRRMGQPPSSPPTLAFTTFYPTRNEWKLHPNPGLRKFFFSAYRQARIRGFRLTEFWGQPQNSDPELIAQNLINRGIQGLILAPLPHSIKSLDFPWERFSVVVVGPSLPHLPLNRIRNNHFDSMVTAMDECHRLGYSRVGLALRKEVNLRTTSRWLAGYLFKQFELGLTDPPKPLLLRNLTERSFIRWITRHRLDAVIVSEPEGPVEWLKNAGYEIPLDIGLVRLAGPALDDFYSGVFENWEVQGVRAVNMLISLLTTNSVGFNDTPHESIVNSLWNSGKTLRQQS